MARPLRYSAVVFGRDSRTKISPSRDGRIPPRYSTSEEKEHGYLMCWPCCYREYSAKSSSHPVLSDAVELILYRTRVPRVENTRRRWSTFNLWYLWSRRINANGKIGCRGNSTTEAERTRPPDRVRVRLLGNRIGSEFARKRICS